MTLSYQKVKQIPFNVYIFSLSSLTVTMEQEVLDDLGETLGVSYKVIDNLSDGKKTYQAQITLTNNSKFTLEYDDWAIYFCHIRMIEPMHLPHSTTYEIPDSGMRFTHVNGCLFKLSPIKPTFKPMMTGDTVTLKFKAQYFSVAKSDLMPNWYLLFPKLRPVMIKSTTGEDMSFVEPFDSEESWKRFDYELADGSTRYDHYNPYNLQTRYNRHKCVDIGQLGPTILPTPLKMTVKKDMTVSLVKEEWCIAADNQLKEEAQYLSSK